MKKILVTGSTSELGISIIKKLILTSNYTIYCQGRDYKKFENYLDNKISKNLIFKEVDFFYGESVQISIDRLFDEIGNIDILINCIGGGGAHLEWEYTDYEKWYSIIHLNCIIPALICRAAVPGMKNIGWGRIINISSIAAHKPLSIGPEYAASKSALNTLTKSLSIAYSKYGITANTISPGLIFTQTIKSSEIDSLSAEEIKNGYCDNSHFLSNRASEKRFRTSTGSLIDFSTIYSLVMFLVSTESKDVTGQDYVIDGGYLTI